MMMDGMGMMMWAVFSFHLGLSLIFIFVMPSGDNALNILKNRYAKGKIRMEGFEEVKRDIE